jgi:hypothetical protein
MWIRGRPMLRDVLRARPRMFRAGCRPAGQVGRLPRDAHSGRSRVRVILLPLTTRGKEVERRLAAHRAWTHLRLRAWFVVQRRVAEAPGRLLRSARCSYPRVFAKRCLRCLEAAQRARVEVLEQESERLSGGRSEERRPDPARSAKCAAARGGPRPEATQQNSAATAGRG